MLKSALKIVLGLAIVPPNLSASPIVFRLGADPMQYYRGADVGPYYATLTHSLGTVFFALDADLAVTFGTNGNSRNYTGTITAPTTEQLQEAAFLTGYSMWESANRSFADPVAELYGPTSFAIWQIMGTLGSKSADPAAAALVALARNAYSSGLISGFAGHVQIFQPSDATVSRFVTVYCDEVAFQSATRSVSSIQAAAPEPAAYFLMGGALIVLVGARRRVFKERSNE